VRPARYDFGNRSLSSLEARCTSAGLDLSPIPASAAGPQAFQIRLPPRSITTITGKMGPQQAETQTKSP
jgi:hypothetical protein